MFDLASSFPPKFKLLREVHGLSTLQIADFFDFKSNGSVTQLEQGTVKPTLAALDNIVSFFGVSLDWLFGISDEIYRPEIILGIEKKIAILGDVGCDWMIRSSYIRYFDATERQSAFSLAVRANIIFCRQVLRKSAEIRSKETIPFSSSVALMPNELYDSKFEAYKAKLWNLIYPMMEKLDGKRRANIRWNLCSTCYDLLQDYIVVADSDPRKRTTPAFDVETEWKKLQERQNEGRKQD